MEHIKIIPCLDVREGRVVKGVKFVNIRDARDPMEAAEAYCREGADELVFLDIYATVENRKTRLEWVKKVCNVVTVPFAVGGGIGSIDDMKALMIDFSIDRIVVDDCAAGMLFIRMMESEGWSVTKMNFRSEKIKKYGAFRRMLNKGLVVSYHDDDLRTEMLAMEYAGNTRQSYIQHAAGYSDDLIDSFVMSSYFYCEEEPDNKTKFFDWGVASD